MSAWRFQRREAPVPHVPTSLVCGLALLVTAGDALAAQSPAVPCVPAGAKRFIQFDTLPAAVRLDLLHRFAPDVREPQLAAMSGTLIARPGANWQATDVVSPGRDLPGRRFILGAQRGALLWVWYESGGIAHVAHVVEYEGQSGGHWRLSRRLTAGSTIGLCAALKTGAAGDDEQFW